MWKWKLSELITELQRLEKKYGSKIGVALMDHDGFSEDSSVQDLDPDVIRGWNHGGFHCSNPELKFWTEMYVNATDENGKEVEYPTLPLNLGFL